MAQRKRDIKGRYVPEKVTEILSQATALKDKATELEAQACKLIENENNPPEWLKTAITAFASACGVTPEDFAERVKLIHPTPSDPVLLVDGKSIFSYI